MHYVRSILRVLAVSSLLPAAAIAQGTITGTVREAGSGRALFGARVTVIGTQISAGTNEQGAYTLRNVPTGTIEVRALAIGHGSQRQTIALGSGASATLDFSLPAVAIQLSDVVTTATGEQRRLEVGSDIARVNAAQLVADQPIKNVHAFSLLDPLSGRIVQRSGSRMLAESPRGAAHAQRCEIQSLSP